MIPYGRQLISESDIAAVVEVLRSDFLTQGPAVGQFEDAFAEMCGANYAIACSNGTAALHLAMLAAGIKEGDCVATSPVTFVASANCAAYVGATPYFVDTDALSHCLSPESLDDKWKSDTRAVVAVDFAGQPAEMPRISEIAREKGAVVIEDACHSVGSRFRYDGAEHSVGGHQWADITTFSFHPVKSLTTGEGGMLVTNDRGFAESARLYRSHGITRNPARWTGPLKPADRQAGAAYYEMQALGYNYRLSDIHAALGKSQLRSLSDFIARRQDLVSRYNKALDGIPALKTPQLADWLCGESSDLSWHLYVVQIDFEQIGNTREQLIRRLRERGVGTQVHYIPVHRQPYYHKNNELTRLPAAEKFYEQALSLPLFPSMTNLEQDQVIESIYELVTGPGK